MAFEIVSPIEDPQTIATGRQIRELACLKRVHGPGRWRKRKGAATVKLPDGSFRRAKLHWHEASGLGRFEFKIKTYLDQP